MQNRLGAVLQLQFQLIFSCRPAILARADSVVHVVEAYFQCAAVGVDVPRLTTLSTRRFAVTRP